MPNQSLLEISTCYTSSTTCYTPPTYIIFPLLQHISKGSTLIDDTNTIKDTSVTTRNFVHVPTKDSLVYVLQFPLLSQILTP